jgi:hypothetical protein
MSSFLSKQYSIVKVRMETEPAWGVSRVSGGIRLSASSQ